MWLSGAAKRREGALLLWRLELRLSCRLFSIRLHLQLKGFIQEHDVGLAVDEIFYARTRMSMK
jgi:hypothetical protein